VLFTVRELIDGQPKAVTVRSDDPVAAALETMIEHDFSQLPVVDGDQEPRFMVSSDSILRALDYFKTSLAKLYVGDAMIEVPTFSLDTDLLQVLDPLRDTYAVLAVDNDKRLAGIVTSYDVTEFFRRQTEDTLLVRDIEQMVKDLILTGLGVTEGDLDTEVVRSAIAEITPSNEEQKKQFRKALVLYLRQLSPDAKSAPNEQWVNDVFTAAFPERPNPKGFNDLTLYEFTQLLLQESRWDRYAETFHGDRESVRNALDSVRQTRNDLFHFRGELTATQRAQLRFCRSWLGRQHLAPPAVTEPTIKVQPSHEAQEPIGEELGPRDSRYARLGVRLQGMPSDSRSILFKFAQLEDIIGEPLPTSARQHRSWWANIATGQSHSREWLDLGWRVATVDIGSEVVEFARSSDREQVFKQFFDALLEDLAGRGTFTLTPGTDRNRNWLVVTPWTDGTKELGWFIVSFVRLQRLRVELYLPEGAKPVFDRLHARESELDADIGDRISWESLPERGAQRIAIYRPCDVDDAREQLAAAREWAVSTLLRLAAALSAKVTPAAGARSTAAK